MLSVIEPPMRPMPMPAPRTVIPAPTALPSIARPAELLVASCSMARIGNVMCVSLYPGLVVLLLLTRARPRPYAREVPASKRDSPAAGRLRYDERAGALHSKAGVLGRACSPTT